MIWHKISALFEKAELFTSLLVMVRLSDVTSSRQGISLEGNMRSICISFCLKKVPPWHSELLYNGP